MTGVVTITINDVNEAPTVSGGPTKDQTPGGQTLP